MSSRSPPSFEVPFVIRLGEGAPQKIRVLQFFYRSVKAAQGVRDTLPSPICDGVDLSRPVASFFWKMNLGRKKSSPGSPEDHIVTRGFRTGCPPKFESIRITLSDLDP